MDAWTDGVTQVGSTDCHLREKKRGRGSSGEGQSPSVVLSLDWMCSIDIKCGTQVNHLRLVDVTIYHKHLAQGQKREEEEKKRSDAG